MLTFITDDVLEEFKREMMANPTPEFLKMIEEAHEIHLVNAEIVLGDTINPRDLVQLRSHEKYPTKVPMVGNDGVLLYGRDLLSVDPVTNKVMKEFKEPVMLDIPENTVINGLVVRKSYSVKTEGTPDFYEDRTCPVKIVPGMSYPVYDILTPEGLIRYDLEGETYISFFNDLLFVDYLFITKLRSLA